MMTKLQKREKEIIDLLKENNIKVTSIIAVKDLCIIKLQDKEIYFNEESCRVITTDEAYYKNNFSQNAKQAVSDIKKQREQT